MALCAVGAGVNGVDHENRPAGDGPSIPAGRTPGLALGGVANDAPPAPRTSLDDRTQLGAEGARWLVRAYPRAGEAVAVRVWGAEGAEVSGGGRGPLTPDEETHPPQAPDARSTRRSRGRMRRYAVANRLRIMVTLTYAGVGCHDFDRFRADVAQFERRLRKRYPRAAFACAFELHPGGHGWHAHAAIPGYVPEPLMRRLWGHGHVFLQAFRGRGGTRRGREASRAVARYLAKYIAKGADVPPGRQRYTVRQGYQPECVEGWIEGPSGLEAAYAWVMGTTRPPQYAWASAGDPEWTGPPVVFAAW